MIRKLSGEEYEELTRLIGALGDSTATEALWAWVQARRPKSPKKSLEEISAAYRVRREIKWRKVIYMRAQGHTYKSIGQAVGVSVERARQLHKQALRQIPHEQERQQMEQMKDWLKKDPEAAISFIEGCIFKPRPTG